MPDLLRADIEFPYAGTLLRPGDVFTTQSDKDTKTLTAIGHATLVEQDAPVELCQEPVKPMKVVLPEIKRRGRPKGSKNKYRRRDMTAE